MLEPSSVDCVIYHANCTDGFGSAFSAWKLLGNRAEYHACTHGTKPPNVKGKRFLFIIFSFNEEIWFKEFSILLDNLKGLIVLIPIFLNGSKSNSSSYNST